MQPVVPTYQPIPQNLTSDCDVPYVPDALDVSGAIDILTDALASLHGCNVRMGLIRKAERERIDYYRKLSEITSN